MKAKTVYDELLESISVKDFLKILSNFEMVVLKEYLSGTSFNDFRTNIEKIFNKKYKMNTIDDALLRTKYRLSRYIIETKKQGVKK